MISVKLAYREIKNNKRYWLFFTANLCIGLIGFTFIHLFKTNITNALEQRSKTLLTSDIALSGRRDLSVQEKTQMFEYMNKYSSESTSLREIYSMARTSRASDAKSRLAFIKAVKGKYPLVGNIELKNNGPLNESFIHKMQTNPWVIISKEIAHQFKVSVGDKLEIGEQSFDIIDIFISDSTSSLRGVSLAPKVYIGDTFLDKTNLIQFGSIAFYSYYFTLKQKLDLKVMKDELYKIVTDPAIRVQTPEGSSEQLGRIVNNLSNYLGLIGIVALLISCVGASYLFQSHIFDRLKQIGILKSLGVSKSSQLLSFVWIILLFGVIGTMVSLFFAHSMLPLAFTYFKKWVSFDISIQMDMKMILTIIGIGVITNLLVCLPILDKVFQSKTIDLLNQDVKNKINFKTLIYYVPSIIFLWLLSVWQSNSFLVGSIFVGSLFIIFLVVLMVLPFVLNLISNHLKTTPINKPLSLFFGYGLRLVTRNKLSTLLTILCLSIGVSLLSVIGQLDKSLKSELIGDSSPKPSLFLFDIQEEQHDELIKFAADNNIPLKSPTPMVRARLRKKNGVVVKRKVKEQGFTTSEEERKRRFNNRGVNLSYANGLNSSEKIVSGKPFTGSYSGEGLAEISLEKRYARRMDVGVGDTLTYEILGVMIQGKVVNLRTVKWTSFLPNFFITFQPGVIEDAPKSFLSAIDKVSFEDQLKIQDLVVEKFPNISIINVTELIEKMMTLFAAMAFAIGIMSLCCISVGIFVLYSILQSQMFKKQKDFALQKIIGMRQGDIFKTLFYEYFIIVLVALGIGSFIGFALAILVSKVFLDGIFVINFGFFAIFNSIILFISLIIVWLAFKQYYSKSVKELLN